ncbi:hypothetical protein PMALA_049230 [Plasmodium malariae]|uniref:Plasmodium RESA N-terminal domain-containing protein n=1 Tax=Plasmodium malariae TaxID=5858 RepID=A0A1A8WV57_PLAMA|nr:hypothetical protein PMALA_049230 [Plasmodium malariae]
MFSSILRVTLISLLLFIVKGNSLELGVKEKSPDMQCKNGNSRILTKIDIGIQNDKDLEKHGKEDQKTKEKFKKKGIDDLKVFCPDLPNNNESIYLDELNPEKRKRKGSEQLDEDSLELLEQMWKKEFLQWRKHLYEINKEIFWDFTRICLINNIYFSWGNGVWLKYKNILNKKISEKEYKDYEDYLALKNKNPSDEECNKFISLKRNSFIEFYNTLKEEKTLFIDQVIMEWMKFKERFISRNIKSTMTEKKKLKRKLKKKLKKKKKKKSF